MTRSFNLKGQKNVKAIAAVGGGLLAFAVLGYLLLVSPQRSKASGLQTQIAAAQTQLTAAQAAEHAPPARDPRVDDLFRLTKAMPADTDMPGILLELNEIAGDTGIKFDSITPSAPAAAGTYEEVPLNLSFKGDYYQLSDFLFRLNNLVGEPDGKLNVNGRLYSISGLSFTQSGNVGSALTATLNANAFMYGATIPSAAGSTPAAPATPSSTPSSTPAGTTTTSAAPAAGTGS
jgi:hypothetical protein